MIKIGVPAKGRLAQDSMEWLREMGLEFKEPEGGRRYSAITHGEIEVELVFLPASAIASELYQRNIQFGITGADLLYELPSDWRQRITIQMCLGFGEAELKLAVPKFWIDVETIQDLDDVAALFRAKHGRGLRIATKYHRLSRQFLSGQRFTDYRLVDSRGATEGTVANNLAEAIIDLVSTGRTLDANGLKLISYGTVFQTEAVFAVTMPLSVPGGSTETAWELLKWRDVRHRYSL